jgi:hypothetical protein
MGHDLNITVPQTGDVLHDCARRLLVFCAVDAYFGYDVNGAGEPDPPDVITPTQIRCANAKMQAFAFTSDWTKQRLLDVRLPELSPRLLPTDADLVEMSDQDWRKIRPRIEAAYRRVIVPLRGVKHRIRAVAASKVLHLKRPRPFAIADAYVTGYLGCLRDDPVATALAVADAVRVIGRHERNPSVLSRCAEYLSAHPLGGHRPRLSKARMIDILIWMKANPRYDRLWEALSWPAS